MISKSTDFDLLKFILSKMSETDFTFYGIIFSERERFNELLKYPNFHWKGQLSPEEVPAFLSRCKVGIVPYNPEVTKVTLGDAMKIFEYLAAGTPVVCTRFQAELEQKFQGLINISDDYVEFQNKLQVCLSDDPDENWQKKAWEFVMENSWQKRVQEIVSLADQIRTDTDWK